MTAKDLIAAPARYLLQAQEAAIQDHPVKFTFRPVIDGEFLSDSLIVKIQNGSVDPLPALIGTCRDESAPFMDMNSLPSPLSSRELAHLGVAQMSEIRAKYAEEFPKLPELEMRVRMLTAEEYWIPSIRVAEALAESCAPVWVCRFDYVNSIGVRPMHVSDLRYWWNGLASSKVPSSTQDQYLASCMNAALGVFVRESPTDTIPTQLHWPRYSMTFGETLCWNEKPQIMEHLNKSEQDIWRFVL